MISCPCHHTSTTLPMMPEPLIGPQYRLSHEIARLSPSTFTDECSQVTDTRALGRPSTMDRNEHFARQKGTTPMNARPNIVLVHGAWADGSCWSAVIERLQANGYHRCRGGLGHRVSPAPSTSAACAERAPDSRAPGRIPHPCGTPSDAHLSIKSI
jgi:hypothetical protein